jgi:hypothetical protein
MPEPAPPRVPASPYLAQPIDASGAPAPREAAPRASPRVRPRVRSQDEYRRELDVEEVMSTQQSTDDNLEIGTVTADDFSEATSPPTPPSRRKQQPRSGSRGSTGHKRSSGLDASTAAAAAVRGKNDRLLAETALSRLALDEGLSDSQSNLRRMSARRNTPEPKGRISPKVAVYRQRRAANAPTNGAVPGSPVERRQPSPTVAKELASMQRSYAVALAEIGRLREAQRFDEAKTLAEKALATPDPTTDRPESSRAAGRAGRTTFHQATQPATGSEPMRKRSTSPGIVPRYRDPLARRTSPPMKDLVKGSSSAAGEAGGPRKAPLPLEARGATPRVRYVAQLPRGEPKTDEGNRTGRPPAQHPSTVERTSARSPAGRRQKNNERSSLSKSPARTAASPSDATRSLAAYGTPNYSVRNYTYSQRLLAQHDQLRRQRLTELKAAALESDDPNTLFADPSRTPPRTSRATSRSPSAQAGSRSISQASGGVSARPIRPPRTWSPSAGTRRANPTTPAGYVSPAQRVAAYAAAHAPPRRELPGPVAVTRPVDSTPTSASHPIAVPADDGFTTSAWSTMPLAEYLTALLTHPRHRLRREVEAGLVDNDARCCMALSVVLNQPAVLAAVVAPLVTAQLQARTDAESKLSQLLCAAAGLGAIAAPALQTLLDMLITGVGDRKLVGLAMRAVGGTKALDELIQLADTSTTASARATACYALGLLSNPVSGHTAVLVRPSADDDASTRRPGSYGASRGPTRVDLCQLDDDPITPMNTLDGTTVAPPAVNDGPIGDDDTSAFTVRAKLPAYRSTHIVLDFAAARRLLLQYLASPQCASASAYSTLGDVLATFCAACRSWGGDAAKAASPLKNAVAPLLSAPTPLTLSGCYAGNAAANHALGERIVGCLLHRLGVPGEHASVRCQAMLALQQLPRTWSLHAVAPLLEHAGGSLGAAEDTAVTAARCLGSIACRHPDRRAQEAAVDLLCRWVTRGATAAIVVNSLLGLAAIGLPAGPAAPAVRETLLAVLDAGADGADDQKVARACMACLTAMGSAGVDSLLQVLRDVSRPVAVRVAVAQALSGPDVPKTLREPIARLLAEIVTHEHTNDALLRHVVFAFARVAIAPKAVPLRGDEEAAGKRAPPLPEAALLEDIAADVDRYHLSVRLAAADALAVHGGAAGEVRLLHLLLKSRLAAVRATAANVLVHTGGSPAVGLLLASNDVDGTVREEALASLQRIGLPRIVDTVRGPQRGKLLVALKSCRDFLQFQHDDFMVALRDELALYAAAAGPAVTGFVATASSCGGGDDLDAGGESAPGTPTASTVTAAASAVHSELHLDG